MERESSLVATVHGVTKSRTKVSTQNRQTDRQWKTVWRFLKKIQIELPHAATILLEYVSGENKTLIY